jgi:hypothetical protein
MEENQIKFDGYSLPFIVHSSFKFRMHALFIFLILMFVGFSLIPIAGLGWIYRLICLVFGLFCAFGWLCIGVMKKVFVELTEEGVTYKSLFGSKQIKWTNIVDVKTYCMNNNTFIGIVTKQELMKRKNNFLTVLSDSLGGGYALAISLNTFPKADPQKLYATIFYEAMERQQVDSEEVSEKITEIKVQKENTTESSLSTALFMALIASLISGTLYGLLMSLLKANFLIVPMLGLIWILYSYSKHYQERRVNIIIRFCLGFLCALQFLVATVVASLMLNINQIKVFGIWHVISECITDLIEYPSDYISLYIFTIIFFFIGVFFGCSFKTIRRIKKIFMHKQNGFYIQRDKRYVSIYLIDYAEYNENEEKIAIELFPNTCLIEKDKKNILAFHIPEQVINDLGIDAKNFDRIVSNEKIYYKLDLKGSVEKQLYGYTSILILNKYRQVELIQLEID